MELEEKLLENMQMMYRIAFSILKNDDEIYDAISNTVVKVYEKIDTLKNKDYFKTWTTKILMNECYKIYNNNKKVVYLENYDQENLTYNENYIDFEIRNLVKQLDDDLRQVVVLYYFEDFSVKEISKLIKKPEGTVKSRLSRARKVLQEKLNIQNEDIEEERGKVNG